MTRFSQHITHRMKLFFAAMVICLAWQACAAIPSHALTPTPDSCFDFTASTHTINDYDASNPSCGSDVVIPSTIGGVSVTAIGGYAFQGYDIASVIIPSSIVSIGSQAFEYDDLTTLVIPEGVQSIGGNAFRQNNIASLTLPHHMTNIDSAAFYQNNIATPIVIPDGMTTISDSSFGNNAIPSVTIPDSVAVIQWNAFLSNQLTNVTIPSSVTEMDSLAFGSNQLTSVTLNEGLTLLNGAVFLNNHLTSVTLPVSLTATTGGFGSGAFNDNDITSVIVNGNTPISTLFDGNVTNTGKYITVYTADPTNPYGLTDLAGTYVVNPASVSYSYVNAQGATLAPDYVRTGATLSDYTVAANPGADFSLYYRVGQTVSFTPPAIAGYTAPGVQTFVARAGSNVQKTTYHAPGEATANATPAAPDTGLALTSTRFWPVALGLCVMLGIGLLSVARRVQRR